MAKAPSVRMKKRMMAVLTVFVVLGFATLVGRLFYLQVVTGNFYEQKAVEQQLREITVSAKRGTIYDSNMKTLAKSADVWDLYASPAAFTGDDQRHKVANDLSRITGVSADTLYAQLKKTTSYVVLRRKIEKAEADLIRTYISDNSLGCIGLVGDSKRYYPYGNFASQILGFTGVDNQGLAGLEAQYDSVLRGVDGKIVSAKNAKGTNMPFKYDDYIEPKEGDSLVLTIDEVVQHYLEKHLEDALTQNKVANKATGIVMNVKTGAIVAMATLPGYDPNDPFTLSASDQAKLNGLAGDALAKERNTLLQAMWRNKAISDPYEPGSTFKIVTASAALQEKVVKETDTFYDPGYMIVGGRRISCWKAGGHGHETFLDGIKNSCNPVFMTIAARMGAAAFYKYFQAFGLTEKTGVDLPGEASNAGLYHIAGKDMGPVELAVSSFGQTFKITPVQLITAVAAAANGGELVTPHLVDRIVDSKGNTVKTFGTTIKRQVISAATSKELCGMLEQVVSSGTGKNAYVAGYRVAGKTGTSQKIDVDGGAYLRIASFVGFAPADDPEYAVLVMLDEPHAPNNYGGVIAAPVEGAIMADILPYLGVKPRYTAAELEKLDVKTPDLVGKDIQTVAPTLNTAGLKYRTTGSGSKVLSQVPEAGQSIPPGGTVILDTGPEAVASTAIVPNFIGMTVLQANQAAAAAGINLRLKGPDLTVSTVKATEQSVAQGGKVQPGTVVTVTFCDQQVTVD